MLEVKVTALLSQSEYDRNFWVWILGIIRVSISDERVN